MDRRQKPWYDDLTPSLTLMAAVMCVLVFVVLVVVVFLKFPTPLDGAPAGGRASGEPWPRVDGAFQCNPPEVVAGSTSGVNAPP